VKNVGIFLDAYTSTDEVMSKLKREGFEHIMTTQKGGPIIFGLLPQEKIPVVRDWQGVEAVI
jgi:hypothetical protein